MQAVEIPDRAGELNAELHCVGRRCDIFQFQSAHVGLRAARGALERLRNQFSLIRAIGAGGEKNPAHAFWRQMADEGLVDVLLDECGRVLWPAPPGRALTVGRPAAQSNE
jgi:hypothetical protein